METIFALSNGYIGIRGTPDDMGSVHQPGAFVNGFYESWPIVYPEAAYGFASAGQTLVNVPAATTIRWTVDGASVLAPFPERDHVTRTLDMRRGVLESETAGQTEAGHTVRVRSKRLVSLRHRNLAAISWELEVEGGPAEVVILSEIFNQQDTRSPIHGDNHDPRRGREFDQRVLVPRHQTSNGLRILLGYETQNSELPLVCGIDHIVESDQPVEVTTAAHADSGFVTFRVDAIPHTSIRLTKLIAYHSGEGASVGELADDADRTLDDAAEVGFAGLLATQEEELSAAWSVGDLRIEGQPEVQQAVRWNQFQMIQATHCVERAGVPAKGLSSQGYDGHYFWDMDMFVMPFVLHSRPELARELLRFRYDTLDAARARAAEMSEIGALYPWRTISGEEASAYFLAGTAQYHINAAVAYAVKRYVQATGDDDFLVEVGAEMVIETARLWHGLGFFAADGHFHLHAVTGPDEYTALVNDNTYTNLMAQMHLAYAADTVEWLHAHHPAAHQELSERLDLEADEIAGWREAANHMAVLYDDELGIHEQDADFLDLELWDFSNTPQDEYPLLLHHHPLVLYRHQVLKQSDVVLAMVLRGDLFDADQKARNFAYYEPLTTDDSSLSTPIQAIVAAEVGASDVASRCFEQAVFADLADVYGNAADGVHLASCGATWMTLVMGFGGMRDYEGRLSFDPHLPAAWEALEFSLAIRGRILDVAVRPREIALDLRSGTDLTVSIQGREHVVAPGRRLSLPLL